MVPGEGSGPNVCQHKARVRRQNAEVIQIHSIRALGSQVGVNELIFGIVVDISSRTLMAAV
jgi:hypothetical protein